jgi:peptide deformylase
MHVTVRAVNRYGKEFEINGSELLARAFCHEIEHLDGKLFIDSAEYMLEEDDE